jgi:hypothetical protein
VESLRFSAVKSVVCAAAVAAGFGGTLDRRRTGPCTAPRAVRLAVCATVATASDTEPTERRLPGRVGWFDAEFTLEGSPGTAAKVPLLWD